MLICCWHVLTLARSSHGRREGLVDVGSGDKAPPIMGLL